MGEIRAYLMAFSGPISVVVMLTWFQPGPFAFSAETGTNVSTNEVSVPQMTFGPGPEFQVNNTLNMGNMINACMLNPALGQAQAMMKDGTGAMAIGGVCMGAEMKLDRHSMHCSNFSDNGRFDPNRFEQFKMMVTNSRTYLSCQKNNLQSLQTELSCLSTQVSALQTQIKSLESSFTQNIAGMAEYVGVMKAAEADRAKQFEDVQSHLKGDERTGQKGLLALQQEMDQLVTAMEGEISGIKEAHLSAETQRKAFEEDVARKTMAMANECFSTKREAKYRCVQNGPAVSAREYVLCRYQQNNLIGAGGVVETSTVRSQTAEGKRGQLENILNQILGDSPLETKTPKTQEEAMAQADQAVNVLNPDELEEQYGSKLASFDGNGLGIRSFVMKVIGSCYKQAQKTVSRQREMSSTVLGRNQEAIRAMERQTSKQVNELMTKYTAKYSEALRALTGMHLPVNADGCRNVKPAAQQQCLTDMHTNMRGLFKGTSSNSSMIFTIRGNDPKTNIAFRCKGIDGCAGDLQALARNLEADKNRITAQKKQQIEAFNRKVEGRSKQIAAALSTENIRLNDMLTKLNGRLTAAGVRDAVELGHVKGERLEKDEDGLYRAPNSAMALISNYMGDPGLVDLQDGTFSKSLGAVAERVRQLGREEAEASAMVAQLDGVKNRCADENMREMAKLLKDQVASLSDCYRNVEFCKESSGRMQEWETSIREVFKLQAGSITSSLRSGSANCEVIATHPDVPASAISTCAKAYGKYKEAEADATKGDAIKANLKRERDSACGTTMRAFQKNDPTLRFDDLTQAEIENIADILKDARPKVGVSAASCNAIVEDQIKGTLAEAKSLKESMGGAAGNARNR